MIFICFSFARSIASNFPFIVATRPSHTPAQWRTMRITCGVNPSLETTMTQTVLWLIKFSRLGSFFAVARFAYSANLCSYPSLLDCPDGTSCSIWQLPSFDTDMCVTGISCRFSHRVQKEHIYHPSVYKTQLCESTLTPNGECIEYGRHCSKAHGEADLRQPVYNEDLSHPINMISQQPLQQPSNMDHRPDQQALLVQQQHTPQPYFQGYDDKSNDCTATFCSHFTDILLIVQSQQRVGAVRTPSNSSMHTSLPAPLSNNPQNYISPPNSNSRNTPTRGSAVMFPGGPPGSASNNCGLSNQNPSSNRSLPGRRMSQPKFFPITEGVPWEQREDEQPFAHPHSTPGLRKAASHHEEYSPQPLFSQSSNYHSQFVQAHSQQQHLMHQFAANAAMNPNNPPTASPSTALGPSPSAQPVASNYPSDRRPSARGAEGSNASLVLSAVGHRVNSGPSHVGASSSGFQPGNAMNSDVLLSPNNPLLVAAQEQRDRDREYNSHPSHHSTATIPVSQLRPHTPSGGIYHPPSPRSLHQQHLSARGSATSPSASALQQFNPTSSSPSPSPLPQSVSSNSFHSSLSSHHLPASIIQPPLSNSSSRASPHHFPPPMGRPASVPHGGGRHHAFTHSTHSTSSHHHQHTSSDLRKGSLRSQPQNNGATSATPQQQPGNDREQFELPDHRLYMYGFRVQTCKLFLEGKCPLDSYTCFDAHSRIPRRRKPQLHNGRFNYIPTRCRYVLEDQECPQGIHCRFAHGM